MYQNTDLCIIVIALSIFISDFQSEYYLKGWSVIGTQLHIKLKKVYSIDYFDI